MECPFCGEEIEDGQPKIFDGSDWLHIGCAIKDADGRSIDAEHED